MDASKGKETATSRGYSMSQAQQDESSPLETALELGYNAAIDGKDLDELKKEAGMA